MQIINLYGGAATGKSTLAANIFVECKKLGIKTELVGEMAKWLHYENSLGVLQDQQYVFAEQLHRLKVLQNYGVEVAICDSPLLIEIVYDSCPDEKFNDWIIYNYKKFDNIDFVLSRNDNFFFTDGRPETNIEVATNRDNEIISILDNNQIKYTVINPLNNNIPIIMQKIKNKILEKSKKVLDISVDL